MGFRRIMRSAVAGIMTMICAASGTAVHGSTPSAVQLAALKGIELGQWQLKERDNGAVRNLCVTNPASLLQLRHGNVQCSHFVVEDAPTSATIHYTCPGHGYGRTTISVETPRLIRIETQGVLDGAPFQNELEGRRVGVCK